MTGHVFDLARRVGSRLFVLDSAMSTNDELVVRAAHGAEAYDAVVTTDQTGGRGRQGRSWVSPPGTGLAVSVLIPAMPPERLAWVPLVAGLAMRETLAELVSAPVTVKWPNDVLIGESKVCGVLAELVAAGVVVGAGVNIRSTAEQLPVASATSLVLAGVRDQDDLDDRVLAGYLSRLRTWAEALREHGADASGLRAAVTDACGTLRREVRVELPDGGVLHGRAIAIGPDARLAVERDDGGVEHIAAGDIVHLRSAG